VLVLKLGGSLLGFDRACEHLRLLLEDLERAPCIVVIGGGEAANELRRQFAAGHLSLEEAHWRCIEAMGRNAEQLAAQFPGAKFTPEIRAGAFDTGLTFVDTYHFLREQEPYATGRKLAHNWDVTSDSIAGRLAVILEASSFWLLKSAPPPCEDLPGLARAGYVDPFLPHLAADLPPTCAVDLRHEPQRRRRVMLCRSSVG